MKQKFNAQSAQKIWQQKGLTRAKDNQKPKFYCLDMFPYPSGEGLHVGHWRGYVLSDVWTRYQILKGKNVLHPMGFDAFGLPAENAAIAKKTHPRIYTQNAIKKFKKQLSQIGCLYDWTREINTSDPEYYKWTQWLFLKLFEHGLAYRKKALTNYCPSCKTVLANEQVVQGKCERCGDEIIKKELKQWFFKITDFAKPLLADLEKIDWPERTKTLQRNWIGRSKGVNIKFQIPNYKIQIDVFTTRPDTLFGATYLVLAPENELVKKITTPEQKSKVNKYLDETNNLSEIDRTTLEREKTGVFTGAYAINPANNEKIPIWISDYVLLHYGTGAIMCVPAHDQRDFEFARKFNLPIKQVITPDGKKPRPNQDEQTELKEAYVANGVMVDSDEFSGRYSKQGAIAITKWLEKRGIGKKTISYRLRDWLVSRQRYWGTPIPIIYCRKCWEIRNQKSEILKNYEVIDGKKYAIIPVPENDLPVKLPEKVDFKPTGKSPLANNKKFINVKCPKCGSVNARRETDTLDTFVCSSWYYLRYCDSKNSKKPFDPQKVNFWLPVDLYIGGIEHAILHLLYARFISKFLHSINAVNFDSNGEPFKKLFNIGMIYYQGAKMSKSKGNIVSPDEIVSKYGTDALRGYELFIGPADQDSEWMDNGILGIKRFLEKVHKLVIDNKQSTANNHEFEIELNKTIQKVTDDIEAFRMNTAISALMEMVNTINNQQSIISNDILKKFLILLSPFAPHTAEELWFKLGNKDSIFKEKWPVADEKLIIEEKVVIVVQINGKVRDQIKTKSGLKEKGVAKLAQKSKNTTKWLANKKIKKIIYIPDKLINFVI